MGKKKKITKAGCKGGKRIFKRTWSSPMYQKLLKREHLKIYIYRSTHTHKLFIYYITVFIYYTLPLLMTEVNKGFKGYLNISYYLKELFCFFVLFCFFCRREREMGERKRYQITCMMNILGLSFKPGHLSKWAISVFNPKPNPLPPTISPLSSPCEKKAHTRQSKSCFSSFPNSGKIGKKW